MKVKLATQVLSHTVQAAIFTSICSGLLPLEARHTAEFIGNMDRLFDSFNSDSLRSPKLFKRPLKVDSVHFDFLREMYELFNNISIPDLKKPPPCLAGWQLTIKSLLLLWNDLKDLPCVKYLLTRRLSQDCLENMFSIVRQKGGFRDNPTPKQFGDTFKQMIVKSCLTNCESSNCQSDTGEILLNVMSCAKKVCHEQTESSKANSLPLIESESPVVETDIELPADTLLKQSTDSLAEQNALYYVAGFVCRKYLENHSCDVCRNLLVDELHEYNGDLTKCYMFMKAYDNSKSDFGGLYLPTDKFLLYLSMCEDVFANSFVEIMHQSKVKMRMFNSISKLVDGTWFTENNACSSNLTVIVSKFLSLRIHNCVKLFNDSLVKQSSKKGTTRKLLKVAHL